MMISLPPKRILWVLGIASVLIGHGDDDRFVPPEHAQRLLQAVVPGVKKQFLDIPHAGHHNILITDAPVYATIASFFLAAL